MSAIAEYRAWAEIDLEALANNLRWIRHGVGAGCGVITVVKADAYGHGLRQIAGCLMQNGTDVLGVANLAEASNVRAAGEGWPVLMLGACQSEREFKTLCQANVAATVSSREEILELARVAGRFRQRALVHLKIDTGMSRLGVAPGGALKLATLIAEQPFLSFDGVYTHLSSSEEDALFTGDQLKRFSSCLELFKSAGLVIPKIHALNSGGIAYETTRVGNHVRPGLLVYGITPPGKRTETADWLTRLRPVLALKSRISHIKTISCGSAVSYGQSAVCSRSTRLATVCIGYGDGILRSASRRMEVLIAGQRCPVVGVITMDQMMVDVSHLPMLQRGDEVVVIGAQGEDELLAGDLASAAGSIVWEILTSITQSCLLYTSPSPRD